jgi:hypothetical protein
MKFSSLKWLIVKDCKRYWSRSIDHRRFGPGCFCPD